MMSLLEQAFSAILPQQWLRYFEVTKITQKKHEWNIVLVEKEDCIPTALQGKEVVQNGYMRSIEIYDFPLRGKPAYLKFIRRRWKIKGNNNKSFYNEYDFHPQGMKATKEFGDFLKEFNRREADLLLGDITVSKDSRRQNKTLVQRSLEWFHKRRGTGTTS